MDFLTDKLELIDCFQTATFKTLACFCLFGRGRKFKPPAIRVVVESPLAQTLKKDFIIIANFGHNYHIFFNY